MEMIANLRASINDKLERMKRITRKIARDITRAERNENRRIERRVNRLMGDIVTSLVCRTSRTLARIIVWHNSILSLGFIALFTFIFWFLVCWGFRSIVAACSAVMIALLFASAVEPPDEVNDDDDDNDDHYDHYDDHYDDHHYDDDDHYDDDVDDVDGDESAMRGTDGRILPEPRNLTLSDVRRERNLLTLHILFAEKLKLIIYSYLMEEQDNSLPLCIVAFLLGIIFFVIRVSASSSILVYGVCLLSTVAPRFIFNYCFSDRDRESDTEIEEFAFAVTEDNFKVLNRAGETGDHSPTPPSLDTSASNDLFDEELPGVMPSHTRVIAEDDFRMVEEALTINLSSGSLLAESRLDDSSSSEEDEEISLKPRKINEVNVEDDDDDTSDELNDFEIIDAEEIADINNPNNV